MKTRLLLVICVFLLTIGFASAATAECDAYCKNTEGTVGGACQSAFGCKAGYYHPDTQGLCFLSQCCCKDKTETSCTDTDGGADYLIKGSVICPGKEPVTDKCVDGLLYEYTYKYGALGETMLRCASQFGSNYVCEDGACVEGFEGVELPPGKCSDTDGGADFLTKGSVICPGKDPVTDKCVDGLLHEYTYKYGALGETILRCASQFGSNYVCEDGACVEGFEGVELPPGKCSDTDGGTNLGKQGTCTCPGGNSRYDWCVDDNTVSECWGEPGADEWETDNFNCGEIFGPGWVCKRGACVDNNRTATAKGASPSLQTTAAGSEASIAIRQASGCCVNPNTYPCSFVTTGLGCCPPTLFPAVYGPLNQEDCLANWFYQSADKEACALMNTDNFANAELCEIGCCCRFDATANLIADVTTRLECNSAESHEFMDLDGIACVPEECSFYDDSSGSGGGSGGGAIGDGDEVIIDMPFDEETEFCDNVENTWCLNKTIIEQGLVPVGLPDGAVFTEDPFCIRWTPTDSNIGGNYTVTFFTVDAVPRFTLLIHVNDCNNCPEFVMEDTYGYKAGEFVSFDVAVDPDGDRLIGSVSGIDMANVTEDGLFQWDTTGVEPGTYTATIYVGDGFCTLPEKEVTITLGPTSGHPISFVDILIFGGIFIAMLALIINWVFPALILPALLSVLVGGGIALFLMGWLINQWI